MRSNTAMFVVEQGDMIKKHTLGVVRNSKLAKVVCLYLTRFLYVCKAMRKTMIQNLGNPRMQKGVRIAHIVLVAIMIMYRKLEAGIGLLYGQTNRNTSHLAESSSTARGGRQ